MPTEESVPGFSIKRETPIKMPIFMLVGLMTVVVAATIMWVNLSREVAEQARINEAQDRRFLLLEESVREATRVNNAQDKRFDNIEASQLDLPVIRNDLKWLLKRDDQTTRHP